MGYDYLNKRKWADITREERYFCLELYNSIKGNEKEFVKWLKNDFFWNESDLNIHQFNRKSLDDDSLNWEVGYEVCFYRDYIKAIGFNGEKHIRKTDFPMKRTFDLCLFSEKHIIIIEAKAYEGFTTNQMEEFKKDIDYLKKLLENCPENIAIIGLHRKKKYSPKEETKNNFHALFTWQDLFDGFCKNGAFLKAEGNK